MRGATSTASAACSHVRRVDVDGQVKLTGRRPGSVPRLVPLTTRVVAALNDIPLARPTARPTANRSQVRRSGHNLAAMMLASVPVQLLPTQALRNARVTYYLTRF